MGQNFKRHLAVWQFLIAQTHVRLAKELPLRLQSAMEGENTFLEGLSRGNGYSLRGKNYQRADKDALQRLALGLMMKGYYCILVNGYQPQGIILFEIIF
jgi:hypothetical protein